MKDQRSSYLNTAVVGLAAGLAGAGLALLLAPQSGKRTRRRVKRWGKNMVQRVEEFQEDLTDRLEDLVEDFEEVRSRSLEKGKNISVQVRSELLRPLQASKDLMVRKIQQAESLLNE